MQVSSLSKRTFALKWYMAQWILTGGIYMRWLLDNWLQWCLNSAGGSDISITTSYSEESEKELPPVQLKQHTAICENPQSENTPTVTVNKSSPPRMQEQSTVKDSRVDNSWDRYVCTSEAGSRSHAHTSKIRVMYKVRTCRYICSRKEVYCVPLRCRH